MTFTVRPIEYQIDRIRRMVNAHASRLEALDRPKEQEMISQAILAYPYAHTAEWVNILANRGWYFKDDQDREDFADELEYVEEAIRHNHEQDIEDWILNNAILPRCLVGDEVHFEHRGQSYEGKIIEIRELRAQYVIYVAAMGHVEAGQVGTQGLVLDYEKIHSIVPTPEEFCLRP